MAVHRVALFSAWGGWCEMIGGGMLRGELEGYVFVKKRVVHLVHRRIFEC
jgi:hypothetical protein